MYSKPPTEQRGKAAREAMWLNNWLLVTMLNVTHNNSDHNYMSNILFLNNSSFYYYYCNMSVVKHFSQPVLGGLIVCLLVAKSCSENQKIRVVNQTPVNQ